MGMAEEGGERSPPGHLRARSQWVGWAAFLSPAPPGRHPHLLQDYCVHGTGGQGHVLLGGVWKRCAPHGGEGFQPRSPDPTLHGPRSPQAGWESLAAPPQGPRAGRLCYLLWPHTQIAAGGGHPTPPPASPPPAPGATGWPCPLPEKSVYLLRKELREAGSSLLGGRMGWGSGDMGPRGPPLSQASSWQGHTFCGTVRGHQSLHHWLVSYCERRGGDIIRAWRRGQGPGPDPGHGRDGRRVCTF